MGINNHWQCTEIESILNDQDKCVKGKYLDINFEDRKNLDNILD